MQEVKNNNSKMFPDDCKNDLPERENETPIVTEKYDRANPIPSTIAKTDDIPIENQDFKKTVSSLKFIW